MNEKLREFLEETARILMFLLEHPSIIWIILAAQLMYLLAPLILSLAGLI
jgi:hypothetical protein